MTIKSARRFTAAARISAVHCARFNHGVHHAAGAERVRDQALELALRGRHRLAQSGERRQGRRMTPDSRSDGNAYTWSSVKSASASSAIAIANSSAFNDASEKSTAHRVRCRAAGLFVVPSPQKSCMTGGGDFAARSALRHRSHIDQFLSDCRASEPCPGGSGYWVSARAAVAVAARSPRITAVFISIARA